MMRSELLTILQSQHISVCRISVLDIILIVNTCDGEFGVHVRCRYSFHAEMLAKLSQDTGVLSICPATFPEAEVTLAYLDLLIRDLKRRGFDMHVLPLYHLQRMIAKLALKNEVRQQSLSSSLPHTDCLTHVHQQGPGLVGH